MEALDLVAAALRTNPNAVSALLNYGIILKKLGRYEDALASYDKALAVQPDFAEVFNCRGTVLNELRRPDEALKSCDRALAIRPGFTDAHNNRAILLKEAGRIDEAQKCVEKSIGLDSRNTKSYHILAEIKRFAPGDAYIAAMQELARDTTQIQEDNQIQIYFALGKALADVADHEQSFGYLSRGNALKRRQISYNEVDTLRYLRRIEAVFTRELMRAKQGNGIPSNVPVFIVGMPRSGTTLIEQILASHPQVFGAGELKNLGKLVANIRNDDGVTSSFPELMTTISAVQLRQLGENYLSSIGRLAPSVDRIVDKMPANFEAVGLIHLAMPNARIIHARRDPRDTALSCFSVLFGDGQLNQSYDLKELGRYYRAYDALMEHWRNILPPGVMLEVQYEDLVDDLEEQARRLVAHCGLDWNETCISFHKARRPVRTASAVQVRHPIYYTSVGRWRLYERHLLPLLEALEMPRLEILTKVHHQHKQVA